MTLEKEEDSLDSKEVVEDSGVSGEEEQTVLEDFKTGAEVVKEKEAKKPPARRKRKSTRRSQKQ